MFAKSWSKNRALKVCKVHEAEADSASDCASESMTTSKNCVKRSEKWQYLVRRGAKQAIPL